MSDQTAHVTTAVKARFQNMLKYKISKWLLQHCYIFFPEKDKEIVGFRSMGYKTTKDGALQQYSDRYCKSCSELVISVTEHLVEVVDKLSLLLL